MKKALLFSIVLGIVGCHAIARGLPYGSLAEAYPFSGVAEVQVTVRGAVRDANGPLAGVTVSVVGRDVAVQTDEKGTYSIRADLGDRLRFTGVGHASHEEQVVSGTLDVTLQIGDATLDEVVVTAMGIAREKKALGYAVQDIKADELMKNKNPNVINSLNGKIAGVNVTNSGGAPGASSNIIIRGGTSLERDNQPLFVIDGVPMDNSTGQGDNSAFDGNQNISTTNGNRALDLNPEDIASMSVLKGPAAAALYGLRAAAGAVVITTKKGAEGTVQVGVNSRFGMNWVNKLPEQQTKFKQGSYYNGSLVEQTFESWGDAFAPGENRIDNMRDFYETANMADNSFNISGGSAKAGFYLSGSNMQ